MYRMVVPEHLYSDLYDHYNKTLVPANIFAAPDYPDMQMYICNSLWKDLLEYKNFRFLYYKTKYNTHILELEVEAELDSILMLKLKL